MSFVSYNFGAFRSEIRTLLRRRLSLRDRIRHHKKKVEYHLDKIKEIEVSTLLNVEKELNLLLLKAGNVLD